jgi:hypothetical protein
MGVGTNIYKLFVINGNEIMMYSIINPETKMIQISD